MFIKDDVSIMLRQRDNRRRHSIAGRHFVEEAVALLIDQDSAAAANRFGNQVRGVLLNGRVNLNFTHIHGTGANPLRQRNAAAGGPFMVGGDKTRQIRTIFHHHRAISAETAGRHDDTFGLYLDAFLLIIQQTYPAHFAVSHQDLFHRCIKHHIDAAASDIAHQTTDQIATNRRSVTRTVSPVDTHPAGGGDVIEHDPAMRQPFDGLRRIFHKPTQQLRIVFVVPAF